MRSAILILLFALISAIAINAYSNEKIVSAKYVTRPSSSNFVRSMNLYDHHGIFVGTNLGNYYLLHSMPNAGIVVFKTNLLSRQWNVKRVIQVNHKNLKTIGQAIKQTGIGNGMTNYATGLTCIGAAKTIEKFLER